MFFERCCHILSRRIQEKFESFLPWKNIKKLQYLSDIEEKVCLALSYQPPSCQKEIFQQNSMEILKIFEPFDTLRKMILYFDFITAVDLFREEKFDG